MTLPSPEFILLDPAKNAMGKSTQLRIDAQQQIVDKLEKR